MNSHSHFEDIEIHIARELRRANREICVCVAWITSTNLKIELNLAQRRGVKVTVIYNADYINKNLDLDKEILCYGIKLKNKNIMHHKFCIIDFKTVINGSYNWSKSAKNHEEHIVITNENYSLVKDFYNEFLDLVYYYENRKEELPICNIDYINNRDREVYCEEDAFIFGLIHTSYENIHQVDLMSVWKLCFNEDEPHFTYLYSENDYYLFSDINNSFMFDDAYLTDDYQSPDELLYYLNEERKLAEKYQSIFNDRNIRIHACGTISRYISSFDMKYNIIPDPEINFFWRHKVFKKIIPSNLYEECIIDEIVHFYNNKNIEI